MKTPAPAGRTCAILCAALLGPAMTAASAPLPNITLRVTVQQKEGNTINPGFHVMTLRCYGGSCELESVSLNQCDVSPVSGKQSFPVVVERSSTRDESLRVVDVGGTLAVEERGLDMGGSYVNNYRFGYKRDPDRLVSFSGAFVKDSAILEKVITVEYVPLTGFYSERSLDCAVRLPGVSQLK